jgi:hypothetical protein
MLLKGGVNQVVDLAGRRLRPLLLFQGAKLSWGRLRGHDMASALDIPTVAVYVPTDPAYGARRKDERGREKDLRVPCCLRVKCQPRSHEEIGVKTSWMRAGGSRAIMCRVRPAGRSSSALGAGP